MILFMWIVCSESRFKLHVLIFISALWHVTSKVFRNISKIKCLNIVLHICEVCKELL